MHKKKNVSHIVVVVFRAPFFALVLCCVILWYSKTHTNTRTITLSLKSQLYVYKRARIKYHCISKWNWLFVCDFFFFFYLMAATAFFSTLSFSVYRLIFEKGNNFLPITTNTTELSSQSQVDCNKTC